MKVEDFAKEIGPLLRAAADIKCFNYLDALEKLAATSYANIITRTLDSRVASTVVQAERFCVGPEEKRGKYATPYIVDLGRILLFFEFSYDNIADALEDLLSSISSDIEKIGALVKFRYHYHYEDGERGLCIASVDVMETPSPESRKKELEDTISCISIELWTDDKLNPSDIRIDTPCSMGKERIDISAEVSVSPEDTIEAKLDELVREAMNSARNPESEECIRVPEDLEKDLEESLKAAAEAFRRLVVACSRDLKQVVEARMDKERVARLVVKTLYP